MSISRRNMLKSGLAVSTAFGALHLLSGCKIAPPFKSPLEIVSDPDGLLDLPRGFTYKILSSTGDPMSDGLATPGAPDGMGAFTTNNPDIVRVIRNHEIDQWHLAQENNQYSTISAFGESYKLAEGFDLTMAYDEKSPGAPYPGGCSALDVNIKTLAVVHSELKLAGTATNCAGGITPWGSWLTCEETIQKAGKDANKDHGYVFEVPSAATGLVKPVALKDMGRFVHEAAAVDDKSGSVYLTEDKRKTACLYRFIPNTPGVLAKGGQLQALVITGSPDKSLLNWSENDHVTIGDKMLVEWVDLDNPESPDGDLADRAHAKGAANFTRLEGIWAGDGEIFFVSTEGGQTKDGQVWRYVPSPYEGSVRESEAPGHLSLYIEPNDKNILHSIDNITIAPWGDIFLCEDAYEADNKENRIHRVSKDGSISMFASHNKTYMGAISELTGACFSPDGSTLFVNIQLPGYTLAIQGPWMALSH